MSLDAQISTVVKRNGPNGLIFDADGVTLIGKYGDELSAYRARRRWVDILHRYFLLEKKRDYELSVLSCPENDYFALNCFFISACGRYAFWRLINDQSPEAETQLAENSELDEEQMNYCAELPFEEADFIDQLPWILDAGETKHSQRRTRKVTERLIGFLQGILR